MKQENKKEPCVYAYRMVAPRWERNAFSGEGARKFGGRWNSPGRPLVYVGGSRALTALEMLVHLTSPLSRVKEYRMIEVCIPSECVVHYPASILPKDWRESPAGKSTQEIGDDWLAAGAHLALSVPSAVIPEEINVLINPLHPDVSKLEYSPPKSFYFDPRL
ncbi:MAG: RES family NAD+ phosphorylase [Chthoniobacterales bacterium]